MAEEMLDVRRAAALVGRHPETVRRWVWTGRLTAHRRGNRLLVARGDVEALAGTPTRAPIDLSTWVDRVRSGDRRGTRSSAADLVIADRAGR
jgi:excisionase family DNA binding protein